ncbi:hypothetical protein E2562_026641 [Oryza meyeriana var. granulata]|uniref:Uncharacterized protein n=1 Tax=Oryza meyeriana var. granulata TaxID=110450 RepID=A0A6G1DA22_9ORYZ|nr:hypothetical protein E2562_026641 [Oryza meyeriana var. granulata]
MNQRRWQQLGFELVAVAVQDSGEGMGAGGRRGGRDRGDRPAVANLASRLSLLACSVSPSTSSSPAHGHRAPRTPPPTAA